MCQATDMISFNLHNFFGYSYFSQIEGHKRNSSQSQDLVAHPLLSFFFWHILYLQRQALFARTGYFQFRNKVRLSPLYPQLLAYLLAQNISK